MVEHDFLSNDVICHSTSKLFIWFLFRVQNTVIVFGVGLFAPRSGHQEMTHVVCLSTLHSGWIFSRIFARRIWNDFLCWFVCNPKYEQNQYISMAKQFTADRLSSFQIFLYAPLIAEWFAEKFYAIIIRNTKFWALWMNISCETGKFWQFTFLPIQFRTIIVWRTLSSQAFRCQRADTAASLLKQLSRWETDCLSTRCVCVCADYYLCIMRHATTYMADVCVFAIPEMPITRCAVAHNQ